jgi:hypothetical protein
MSAHSSETRDARRTRGKPTPNARRIRRHWELKDAGYRYVDVGDPVQVAVAPGVYLRSTKVLIDEIEIEAVLVKAGLIAADQTDDHKLVDAAFRIWWGMKCHFNQGPQNGV